MASVLTNNLYPPTVDTYCPAFVGNAGCTLKFSISKYNSAQEIAGVQVMVTRQSTGLSALDREMYPGSVKNYVLNQAADGDYYIILHASDLQDKVFLNNEFYMVQLRFVSKAAVGYSILTSPTTSWNANNSQYLSEWSTVCLIKAISERPRFSFANLTFGSASMYQEIHFSTLELSGRMFFNDMTETEKLNSYYFELYEEGKKVYTKYENEVQYTNKLNNPNTIYFIIPYELQDSKNYIVKMYYTTVNGYSNVILSKMYTNFTNNDLDNLQVSLLVEANKENGLNKISLESLNNEYFSGYFTISRASSKDDFALWEDIYHEQVKHHIFNTEEDIYYDLSIESGVWYKYAIQERDVYQNRGRKINAITNFSMCGDGTVMHENDNIENYTNDIIMCDFDGIFLTSKPFVKKGETTFSQLKFYFDTNIDSYTVNVGEEKIETIGSKYPFIIRAGGRNYRSFSLNSMIVSLMDSDDLFIADEELYGNSYDDYMKYNMIYRVDYQRDYIREKLFRDKVIDFIEDGKNKLYRSATEGNLLIQLIEKTFSPKQEVQGLVYTLQAECVEIDDIKSYAYLKQSLDIVNELSRDQIWESLRTDIIVGCLQVPYSCSDDILNLITQQHRNTTYEDKDGNILDVVRDTVGFNWIDLRFSGSPESVNGKIGYQIYLNNTNFTVDAREEDARGVFKYNSINYDSTTINSLCLSAIDTQRAKDVVVTIYYSAVMDVHKQVSQEPVKHFKQTVYKQFHGNCFLGSRNRKNLRTVLYALYQQYRVYDYDKEHCATNQFLEDAPEMIIGAFNNIEIYGTEGTVIWIRQGNDDSYVTIPSTGYLSIQDKDIDTLAPLSSTTVEQLNNLLISVMYDVEGDY